MIPRSLPKVFLLSQVTVMFFGFVVSQCFCFTNFKQGAALVKSLASNDPSALGLDTYHKQYYLCLAAASANIKWYIVIMVIHQLK